MKTTIVNAVGQPCPYPVVEANKAYMTMTESGILLVRVDNEVAVENLRKFASGKGLAVSSEKKAEKLFEVTIKVEEDGLAHAQTETTPSPELCACTPDGGTVVAIGSAAMGTGSEELGKTLMKGFLYALSQQESLPKTMLFYNGGAALTTEGSLSLEDLREMEKGGTEIYTCGTCLNFYGLTEKLAVGKVTNMYDIVDKLSGAAKIIKP